MSPISYCHTSIQNSKSSPYLHPTFRYAVSVAGRTGRNVHRLYVPAVHLNCGKRSLYYRGTTIWNSPSTSVIETDSLNSFNLAYLKYV